MSGFVCGPVRLSVPATCANLGPGFDSLGLALSLRDELRGEVPAEGGLVIEVSGEGAGRVPLDEGHLVVRAMRIAFEALGHQPDSLHLGCRNAIPHARGLGSSSAAIIGGLMLARALVVDGERRLSEDDVLALAVDLEGHPDNVAPALLGGFVISGTDEHDEVYAVRSPVDARIGAIALVPVDRLSTEVARGLLPDVVPHAAAAANAGRAALLVAALAGRPEQLWRATRDYLHQDFRRPAMPDSLALIDRLRADGLAAVVSGAGPTVLVLGEPAALARVAGACPPGWTELSLSVEPDGALIG